MSMTSHHLDGLTEAQWRRVLPPDYSEFDPRSSQILLADAKELLDLPDKEVGEELARVLGYQGVGLEVRWSKKYFTPDHLAKYGCNLYTPVYDKPGLATIDIIKNPEITNMGRVMHYTGQALRWAWAAEPMQGLDLSPTATVSSFSYPPARQ